MSPQVLRYERSGAVAWLRLNRPHAMNALNHELLDQLNARLDDIESDPTVRVVVLSGTGRGFCTGADLKDITGRDGSIDTDAFMNFVHLGSATINRFSTLERPTLAAVNGLALAGGMELMMSCDIAIAAEIARIGDAHSNYGLLPGCGGTARLTRRAGPTVAKYLTFSGEALPARSLIPYGLVNEVVPDHHLESHVELLAQRLAKKSMAGLASMKRLINNTLDHSLADALRHEHEALTAHAQSKDLVEGINAFREKRQPFFQDA